ncbi:MAG: monovalent cation/H(+) antiporter subunit G [Bacillota bacterium]
MLINYLSTLFILAGVFFFTVGVVGLLRFPDVYTRLHATTKCDTLGAGLILVGLALQGSPSVVVKLVLIIILLWITNPTAAHVISRAALNSGIPQAKGSFEMNLAAPGKEEPKE